jgi:transposase
MSKRSSAEWARLVSRWKRSGQTAEEFAGKVGVKASSLRWWSWALGKRRSRNHEEPSVATEPVPAFLPVHVVSRDAPHEPSASAPLEIIVDDRLTVRVGAGFDEDTLIRVLDLLRRTEAT